MDEEQFQRSTSLGGTYKRSSQCLKHTKFSRKIKVVHLKWNHLFDFPPTVHPPSYVIGSNYSYRQNIGSCLCSRFKNHKFPLYSIHRRRLPEVLGFNVFSSTRIPIVLFLNPVLRPSNKKSTVIGNITHEWPRLCLKER